MAGGQRPPALSFLAIGYAALGILWALGFVSLVIVARRAGSTEVSGTLSLLTLAALPSFGRLAVAWGIRASRPWARPMGYVVAIVGLLAVPAVFIALTDLASARSATMLAMAGYPVAIDAGALIILSLPSSRAHFRDLSAGSPAEVRAALHVKRRWAVAGAVVGGLLLWQLASYPLRSLRTRADGDTLREDAIVGLFFAAVLLAVGIWAFTRIAREFSSHVGSMAASYVVGAGFGWLLIAAVLAMSVSDIVDGRAGGDEPMGFVVMGLLVAVVAGCAYFLEAPSLRRAVLHAIGVSTIAFGSMLFVGCSYILAHAQPLQDAAEARRRYYTPGFETVLLLLALALALLIARRKR